MYDKIIGTQDMYLVIGAISIGKTNGLLNLANDCSLLGMKYYTDLFSHFKKK